MLLQAAKYVGAGLATIGLAGAGVGIGTVWMGSLLGAFRVGMFVFRNTFHTCNLFSCKSFMLGCSTFYYA